MDNSSNNKKDIKITDIILISIGVLANIIFLYIVFIIPKNYNISSNLYLIYLSLIPIIGCTFIFMGLNNIFKWFDIKIYDIMLRFIENFRLSFAFIILTVFFVIATLMLTASVYAANEGVQILQKARIYHYAENRNDHDQFP